MKGLFLGIFFIILVGIGGLVYRNALEYPARTVVCPLDSLMCPDGTSVSRMGNSCSFAICPAPNVSFPDQNFSFALPEGFAAIAPLDGASIAAYTRPASASSTNDATIVIRRYAVATSSTPLSVIQETAVGGASGLPVPAIKFSSTVLGTHRYTIVTLDRLDGVVDTAYYLARSDDVLRFDAIDMNVSNWADPDLDLSTLPAHAAVIKLLTSLQGQ